jgi:hypothetical protein
MSFWDKLSEQLAVLSSAPLIQQDTWINEMLILISDSDKLHSALIRIAYDLGGMNNSIQQSIIVRLQLKSLNNDLSKQLLSYIEYVRDVENDITQLISGDSELNWADYASSLAKMQYIEIAAHYGLIKAYSKHNPKANFFCDKIEAFFNAKR